RPEPPALLTLAGLAPRAGRGVRVDGARREKFFWPRERRLTPRRASAPFLPGSDWFWPAPTVRPFGPPASGGSERAQTYPLPDRRCSRCGSGEAAPRSSWPPQSPPASDKSPSAQSVAQDLCPGLTLERSLAVARSPRAAPQR